MQYNKPAGPQQQYHALQQHQQQQQYNGYVNGYATALHQQQQRVGGYPNPQHGQQGAAAAAGAQRWAAPQQQQQAKQQQHAGINGMHGHYHQQQQQQQQNAHHAGPMAHGGTGHDVMSHMTHAQVGPAYNSSAGFNSAPAAGTPASLTQALAAMAAVLPANFDYATAFEAFSKVMGRTEAAAFTQQFTAAMQQQQQVQRQQH
jgi:hypothetical protein